jgi:beta-glucanase (GH16 family)
MPQRKKKDRDRADDDEWVLTFEDDFDEGRSEKWGVNTPWTFVPGDQDELQRYDESAIEVRDGVLHLTATKTGRRGYRSGMIHTHGRFEQEYGRFEIRCKMPAGQGFWPAFWLLAEDWNSAEIDVFEVIGREPNVINMNVHWQDGGHQQEPGRYDGPVDYADDFHTFAVEWDPREIVWYVDGEERHRVKGRSPKGRMHMIANLAVGGEWPGPPDRTTKFPSSLAIDYIRAYKKRGEPTSGTTRRKRREDRMESAADEPTSDSSIE